MNDRLENELRRALRREEPPPEFAARVVAAAEAEAARRASRWAWLRFPALRWAAAAVACVLVLAAGIAVEQRRQREIRARGEAAKEQVMLALKIAGAKLHVAQAKVTRRPLTENNI